MVKELFYVKIAGIIFDTTTRKILIGKAKGDEKYSFLEGNLNHEEELDVCLKRIAKEKTGFKIHNLGAVYAENMLKDKEKLKIHFLCEVGEEENQLVLGENIEELIWVKPSNVEKKIGISLPSRLHEYLIGLD